MLTALLQLIATVLSVTYLVLDGHFGNHNALDMARQCGLHLISKLRCDAALYFPYTGVYAGRGPRRKYGPKVDYDHLPVQYLKETSVEGHIETCLYQMQVLHKEYWGLEDFMNVTPTGVTNAANLSLFMVNVAYRLRADVHPRDPDYSVLDLKADCRGYKYVEETIKMLPEKPEPILLRQILNKVAGLGRIHASQPSFSFS
jgi:DDE superfamily endonuclease